MAELIAKRGRDSCLAFEILRGLNSVGQSTSATCLTVPIPELPTWSSFRHTKLLHTERSTWLTSLPRKSPTKKRFNHDGVESSELSLWTKGIGSVTQSLLTTFLPRQNLQWQPPPPYLCRHAISISSSVHCWNSGSNHCCFTPSLRIDICVLISAQHLDLVQRITRLRNGSPIFPCPCLR